MDTLASIALSAESSYSWQETPVADCYYDEEPSGATFVGIESSPEMQFSPNSARKSFFDQTLFQATKDWFLDYK